MRIKVISAFIMLASFPATAQEIRIPQVPERFNVGGYIKIGRTTPYTFHPHSNPRVLPPANMDENGNRDAAAASRNYLSNAGHVTGMMLIDHGKIVFEGYKGQGNKASEFYSMSIAKSLTSLAVGKALCNGALKSLDTRVGDLVQKTKINNLGRSTVRQLLTMSSGVWSTAISGQPKFTGGLGRRPKDGKGFIAPAWPFRLGQMTVGDYLWGEGWEKAENKNHAEPGEAFVYKGADALALSKVLEAATGMSAAAYFDKHVWQMSRGENMAHWEADKEGTTITDLGFQATLRDWGRIAIWVLDQLKKPGCYGDYLRKSTTTQIENAHLGPDAGKTFDGYGYQWWTDNRQAPGFWGKGYAGQELGINPKTEKILIKFSYRPNKDVYKIFREWNRQ